MTDSVSLLANDGMTAWYSDPRAICDSGALFYVSVSGTTTGGNVEFHRVVGGVRDTWLLAGELEIDDHNNGAILRLSSGRVCCFYGQHTDLGGTRYRISNYALPNIGGFGPEFKCSTTIAGKSNSYCHPFLLSDGNVYLFRRNNVDTGGTERHQELCVESEANILAGAASWSTRTDLLFTALQRPYAKYVQNGADRIDCFVSKGSPGEISSACPVYHMYLQLVGGVAKFYKSDGTEITGTKPLDVASNLTVVKNSVSNNDMLWTWGIAIGADGYPRCLSNLYPTPSIGVLRHDIEYWHHRWTGSTWVSTRLSTGNTALYAAQNSYSPGLCFDGNDTSTIYMSENDATTGVAEIKKYHFDETTATLSVVATLTTASAYNNVRPFSPAGHDADSVLIWATGVYLEYINYEMDLHVYGATPVASRLGNPVSYEAETTALLARMSVQPTLTHKNVIDRRIKRLKAAPHTGSNLWAKKAVDYQFQQHDTQAELLDWKGAHDITIVGVPVLTVNLGFKGTADGSGYLLGPAPNAIGAPFSQNDAHMVGYYGHTTGNAAVFRRITSGPQVYMSSSGSGANDLMRLNTASGYTTANSNNPSTVHHAASRSASNVVRFFRDGAVIGNNSDASAALDSAALAFGYQHSGGYIRGISFGSHLTDDEMADLFFIDWEYTRDARATVSDGGTADPVLYTGSFTLTGASLLFGVSGAYSGGSFALAGQDLGFNYLRPSDSKLHLRFKRV